jgi:hypothetical protein
MASSSSNSQISSAASSIVARIASTTLRAENFIRDAHGTQPKPQQKMPGKPRTTLTSRGS